jgi:pimeloyl-ACP methyl ester carboxylesterase
MLVWLYPSNPSVVKTGLAEGILRDSQDPGASDVIAAGGKLPKPRPMNDIFREYTGPVLIAQGALDPLNDAKSRANIFKGIREGVTLDLLPLGHCPMDENPKMVRYTLRRY